MEGVSNKRETRETLEEKYLRITTSEDPVYVSVLSGIENERIFSDKFNEYFSIALQDEGAGLVDNDEYLHRERVFTWKLEKENVLDTNNNNDYNYYTFIENKLRYNPTRMGLALLSFTNIDHISKQSEVFKQLSSLAFNHLNILPKEWAMRTTNVKILRGLSRKGLLDWNNFLSKGVLNQLEEKLINEYKVSINRSIDYYSERLSKRYEVSPFTYDKKNEIHDERNLSENINLDDFSQEKLKKYFHSKTLKFNSLEDKNGVKVFSRLDAKESYHIRDLNIYMTEIDICHMPEHDFRFNFNMEHSFEERKEKVDLLAKVLAKAHIEGVPIMSKTTSIDESLSKNDYISRYMIYVDVYTAKKILGYIKDISPEVFEEKYSHDEVEFDEKMRVGYLRLFNDKGIFIRGSKESSFDDRKEKVMLSNLKSIIYEE